MSESRIKLPPYPEDYAGHVRQTPEECLFGDGLPREEWEERMFGMEYSSAFTYLLYDPFSEQLEGQPRPYEDYLFLAEDRMCNGERKKFYIRIDPRWIDAVLDAEEESMKEPAPFEFPLEGGLYANIRWSVEHNAYLAKVPAYQGCFVLGATFQEAEEKMRSAAKEWETHPFEPEPACPPPILG